MKGYSLYIRPTYLGISNVLGVHRAESSKLFVVCTPVGPYFPTGFAPISLFCDEKVVRAWPGGVGNRKVGGNYAPGILPTEKIKNDGFSQLLWLVSKFYSDNHVTEVGTMNFFVFWKNINGELELITPPLDGTILPGVTRDSILVSSKQALARDWNEFKVTERVFMIHDLIEALEQGRVIEAFGTGTACVVSPVNRIHFAGKDYSIPLELTTSGKLTQRFWDALNQIYYGEIDHPWAKVIG